MLEDETGEQQSNQHGICDLLVLAGFPVTEVLPGPEIEVANDVSTS
ncbi:hypothetical protein GCM10017783_25750 [Deinococcus piscis]|uniref:Uncharacterized protein n=1 Tax=Deinococcus piscis TaxID=394230 RepID=A0ABQ3KBH9_9DEIO|nr:hypothetical protein GCM10017783_25750 [Deinococcus piscis]